MKQELAQAIAAEVQKLFKVDVTVELTRPDEQFGDYATNVALQLAKSVGKNPREIAEIVAAKIEVGARKQVESATVAGPGFINIKLNDLTLLNSLDSASSQTRKDEVVVAEYSDPNPFKVLHAGHVYTTIVGDAIANLLERAGAEVHRVNYGGDVGRHVATALWAILQELGGEQPDKLATIAEDKRAEWMAAAYVRGFAAFEAEEQAKAEIVALNKRVYAIHADNDHNSALALIYWTCREWSYQAFDAFYARLGTSMERYYPESEVADIGVELVREHLGTVFQESDGAVVFEGEKFDLHTRVFINSEGLPTYEAKEIGLIVKKKQDYDFDRSVVITGNEQQQYMAVMLKAIEQFLPDLAAATVYVPHGMVRLAGGVKMSSRLGNIIPAQSVIDVTTTAIKDTGREPSDAVILGAIKYAFLKNRIGGDVVYDPKESISLEGNSGPYLQYAHARARSILSRAHRPELDSESSAGPEKILKLVQDDGLQPGERSLVRKLSEYAEVVDVAVSELMPHLVATYLYELAQVFNRFYEYNRVIGDEREAVRLYLVGRYADTLKSGLELLGIEAPDKM